HRGISNPHPFPAPIGKSPILSSSSLSRLHSYSPSPRKSIWKHACFGKIFWQCLNSASFRKKACLSTLPSHISSITLFVKPALLLAISIFVVTKTCSQPSILTVISSHVHGGVSHATVNLIKP